MPRRTARLARLVVAALVSGVLVGVVGVTAPPAARPAGAATRNPIMGKPTMNPDGIVAWYRSRRGIPAYRATVPIETLAALFITEGLAENVRGDIAFAQSIKESAWFNFPDYGQVRPWDNNFAGIGACNSCNGGRTFADAQLGVRAQIQHLRNYADPTSRSWNLHYPPWTSAQSYDTFFYKGAAPNWEDLNGKWAYPGVGYGESIIDLYASMLQYAGVNMFCPPDNGAQSTQTRGTGYYMAASDGGVFTFGNAQYYGSAGNLPLQRPIVGMSVTGGGTGYYLFAGDGGIFTYGSARFYGSTGNLVLNRPIVGMGPKPGGGGYWLVASDGGVFSFGSARFHGSTGNLVLNRPIVGMAVTPSGNGYWLFASDGGVFSFGDAQFLGSLGGQPLSAPIVAATNAGGGRNGYYLLGFDGAVYAFGDATARGGLTGCPGRWAVSISADASNGGYWIATAEGRVAVFGDATHWGWPFRANLPPIAIAGVG